MNQIPEIKKIKVIGINYGRNFPDLERLMEHVEPGMRVGLALTKEMLEYVLKLEEGAKPRAEYLASDEYQFIKKLVAKITEKKAAIVPLYEEKFLKKLLKENIGILKEVEKKEFRINYDVLFGGGSSKSPFEIREEIVKELEAHQKNQALRFNKKILEKIINEKVHVAILGREDPSGNPSSTIETIKNEGTKLKPLEFEFLEFD